MLPSSFTRYREPIRSWSSEPRECPMPYTGSACACEPSSFNARWNLKWMSSATRVWSNPV